MVQTGVMGMNPAASGEIDQFDRRIIEMLLQDGRMTVTELAARVGLSKTPCQVRMRRLIRDGYIEGFRAVVNPARLGLVHVAFAEVKLTTTGDEALGRFNEAVKAIPEIEECHMIAGRYDYLLKVRTTDIAQYRYVLGERISSLPYVAGTSTSVVMEVVKESWGG
jgi:Lrp/AsnC family leucine-responsive transcriptional regulator